MVRSWTVRWLQWALVCWLYSGVGGYIEIVEEQKCHDTEFRLTCRDLQTHIAVLEAWYTKLEDYNATADPTNTINNTTPLRMERDAELNRVYLYSSPKHDGYYEPMNHSIFENITRFVNYTDIRMSNNSLFGFNDRENDTVTDTSVDLIDSVVSGECGVESFSRSYGSTRESGTKHVKVARSEASVNLRSPVSYRCTGVNHCNFLLSQDFRHTYGWPPGVVYIKYACFDDTASVHYCNREVKVGATGEDSEGYIRSPGYPHFYIGDGECRWRLQTSPEQRLRITLMDVSLRSIGPFEKECTDYLMVLDSNGESLLSSCDQVELPVQLVSQTSSVDIILEANSEGAFPKRGVLIHYKSVGCVTLPPPSNGYLVYRNADVAHYMCNVNRVFADDGQRARVIWCYEDNKWNGSVPFCLEETALRAVAKNSSAGWGNSRKVPHGEANMIVDIVIPSLLIAALFIGNAVIVLVIYKYRKRKPEDSEDEFNTIPLNGNGSIQCAGNAV